MPLIYLVILRAEELLKKNRRAGLLGSLTERFAGEVGRAPNAFLLSILSALLNVPTERIARFLSLGLKLSFRFSVCVLS